MCSKYMLTLFCPALRYETRQSQPLQETQALQVDQLRSPRACLILLDHSAWLLWWPLAWEQTRCCYWNPGYPLEVPGLLLECRFPDNWTLLLFLKSLCSSVRPCRPPWPLPPQAPSARWSDSSPGRLTLPSYRRPGSTLPGLQGALRLGRRSETTAPAPVVQLVSGRWPVEDPRNLCLKGAPCNPC